jgi:aminoglycoside phosphotransferase (APT) family kinase protein
MAPIPHEVGDLSPEWFTDVLGTGVSAVDVLDSHSGTTGRARVRITGTPGGSAPETVFVKLQPFTEQQRAFLRAVGIGVSEARFYAVLGPALPVRAPTVLHAETDGQTAFVMVLEDLVASGCRFTRPSDPDIEERAASTVHELAQLHAGFWESPRFAADLAWVPDRAGFGPAGGGHDEQAAQAAGHFVRRALDRFAADMPPVFTRVGELYADHTAAVLDLWDEGERTLIHGDPHIGNLFSDDGRTGFYDWAMVSRSPAMRDVAYFCTNSVPRDVRRRIEGELLRSYRADLAGHGIQLDAELVSEQYRLFAVFSWVSAVSTAAVGSRWQPAAAALGAMERTTAALDDLDCAGGLESQLGIRP